MEEQTISQHDLKKMAIMALRNSLEKTIDEQSCMADILTRIWYQLDSECRANLLFIIHSTLKKPKIGIVLKHELWVQFLQSIRKK